MYTLKGVFPEPKKEPKRNFIKENVRQLKLIQGKATEPKFLLKPGRGSRVTGSPPSNSRSSHSTLQNAKSSKKLPVEKIRKGDMAEFLKRKQLSQHRLEQEARAKEAPVSSGSSQPSTSRLRHTAVQTLESSLRDDKDKKVAVLYKQNSARGAIVPHNGLRTPPKLSQRSDDGDKSRMSGDGARNSSATRRSHRGDDLDVFDSRSKLTAILDQSNKDPYLPSGYQKGVVPKYIRSRKDKEGARCDELLDEGACPPGHVLLPDAERKETLKMLRNSFGELVSEMNKMPVKTDTLKMRNRKMELEKQLAKLEEGIKLFSRPKVFVKIE